MFQVDAFASRPFHGNPAAVVFIDGGKWLDSSLMQAIAAENNLAETAFVLRSKGSSHGIRWFTPTVEVDLCGHATLAAAHSLWNHAAHKGDGITFDSRSGKLTVKRDRRAASGELIVLDFPALPGKSVKVTGAMCAALGCNIIEAFKATSLMCVLDNRREVYELEPDMARIREIDDHGVIVTAPGSGHDFVSRFFAPNVGIAEDPVTGSAHCTLVPYWSKVLRKKSLAAHQTSERGGELWCEDRGKRVSIAGHATTFLTGSIRV